MVALGIVQVPAFLEKPTGIWYLDIVPAASMASTLPTLWVFYKTRRYMDLVVYFIGFLLALVFHTLHLSQEGLSGTLFLGATAAQWRTWDILVANLLMARTLGHAVGDDHLLVTIFPNAMLPAALFASIALYPSITIQHVIRLTGISLILMLFTKVVVAGGWTDFPLYQLQRSRHMAVCWCLGLVCFGMPHAQPQRYWLWHSLWHMLMAAAFLDLYTQLEGLGPWGGGKGRSRVKAEVKRSQKDKKAIKAKAV